MSSSIKELSQNVGFSGTNNHRIAEPRQNFSLPVIDNSTPHESNITTSIDVYVSGQYVVGAGRVMEVRQRYSVYVQYSKSTQQKTMNEIRTQVMKDFEDRYGDTFNITTIDIPKLQIPKEAILPGTPPGQASPAEFYHGTTLFREMTRYERMRTEVKTQKEMSDVNIEAIRKRYGFRR